MNIKLTLSKHMHSYTGRTKTYVRITKSHFLTLKHLRFESEKKPCGKQMS